MQSTELIDRIYPNHPNPGKKIPDIVKATVKAREIAKKTQQGLTLGMLISTSIRVAIR